ncbi:hypothetical protein ABH911_003081 [Pseudomonas protegens]|uniref:hypothetical protein n=1 Tax=Pseudomonas protegens TaxID=380021 RepID=UPI0034D4C4D9
MILARVKSYIKRLINWWRRRRDVAARVSRLESEVQSLRTRIEVMSAFYERRLDAAIHALMERESKPGCSQYKSELDSSKSTQ